MQPILSSVNNQLVKEVIKLKTVKGRQKATHFIVEGQRACSTFIQNGYTPVHLFATEKNLDYAEKLFNNTLLVTEALFQKMSSAKTPSGILALFAIPNTVNNKKLSAGLVLADIADPGNMGTLIRSAAAFNYKTVVIVGGCNPYSPKVLQATAGTLPLVNLFLFSWPELLQYKKDLRLTALVVKDGKSPQELKGNRLFVVGNEARGINPVYLKDCDDLVTLPMPGNTESLNAAVAGSLILALQNLTH
ncbi:MAG: RNA methyltransferase [Candidatus Babeliales bacterium]|jgi:TrmH family RNA methyltransferase